MSDKTETPLDIGAWLAGAERPEGTIRISSKGKAVVERAGLVRERNQAAERKGGRMAAPVDPDLEKRIAALDKAIAAGEREFTLRAVDPDVYRELTAKYGGNGFELDEHIVAASLVEPKMDRDQVHRLRSAVGQGQFKRLAGLAVHLSNSESPSADF